MTKSIDAEEFKEIVRKVDDKTLRKIFSKDIRIERYHDGKFEIIIGNLVLAHVDLMIGRIDTYVRRGGFKRRGEVDVGLMLSSSSNITSTLVDDLREAVGEKPEEEEELEDLIVPEVDDDENEEGIMQLAELFEEDEK